MDLPYICPISPLYLRCISLYLPTQEREADIMDLLYALDGHGRRTHDVRDLPCISPASPLYLPPLPLPLPLPLTLTLTLGRRARLRLLA